MSVGGQSNAPQTPFSPNYRERRSVQPRGPGNAYTQRPGQQPNPQQPAQLQPAPQPRFGQPDQPPPGMELNPDYIDRFAGGMAGTMDVRPTDNKFRPIQQPEPQTGGDIQYRDTKFRRGSGDIQYAGGTPGFYNQGGQGYGNPFGGGFGGGYSSPFGGGFGGGYSTPFSDYGGGFGGGYGGGYSSPYMSPSMMGGLASLFGGMQGGGFQGMFNPGFQQYPSNDQAARQQMALQRQMTDPSYRMSGGLGLNPPMPVNAPSDYEIAQSLGFGDSGITDMRVRSPEEYKQEEKTRQARAKSYLDSIGYGQSGFDPSKYEVKRRPLGNISSGRGFA